VATADLVIASWIAIGGAEVETPEAYTGPAAVGLLLIAIPALRSGAGSWAAEGAAVGVALVPSALVVVAEPTALRLVLVLAAATVLTVAGTLLHRQAPFVVGAGALFVVAVGRLAPYAPLLPRWVTLGAAGLLLLVVGATYERRRQQAREAVAWVAEMR
jgi:cell division protein FtsW (lipid II flippase)